MTSTEPTIEYIRYRIPPERADDLMSAYRSAAVPLKASPYCIDYELTQGVEEPDRFVLRIAWTSVDDHLQKFRRGSQFREFFGHIAPFVDQIEEMAHYTTRLRL